MELKTKTYDELTKDELYEILGARESVFTVEKGMICHDIDGKDRDALHCSLYDGDTLLGYLRALRDGSGCVKIGRVITLTHGKGHGRVLFDKALPELCRKMNTDTVTVHAQKDAVGFYLKMGFTPTSGEFLEEGVVHISMQKLFKYF